MRRVAAVPAIVFQLERGRPRPRGVGAEQAPALRGMARRDDAPCRCCSLASFPSGLHVIFYNYTDWGGISPVPVAISTSPRSISPRKSGICTRAGSAAHGTRSSYRLSSDIYPGILDIYPSSGRALPMNLDTERSPGSSHPGILGIGGRDLGISAIIPGTYPRLGTVSPGLACVCRRPACISPEPASIFHRPEYVSKIPGSVVSRPAGISKTPGCISADLGRIYFRLGDIFSRPRSSFQRPASVVRAPGSAQTKAGRLALTEESACLRPGRGS